MTSASAASTALWVRQFPTSPYAELGPEHRWFPAAEELRAAAYEKLLPPLFLVFNKVR